MDESIKQKVEKAAQKWLSINMSDEAIESYVDRVLNQQRDNIFAQALGFEIDHWDHKWRINSTNGNMSRSAAGQFIKEKAGIAVNNWLEENAGNLPKLDKNAVESLRKTYKEIYKNILRDQIVQLAEDDADKEVDQILDKLVKESCAEVIQNEFGTKV